MGPIGCPETSARYYHSVCLFSWRYNPFGCIFHTPVAGFSLLIRGFFFTHNDAPQSVWLLWTSDQLDAETSTWQHTTLTTNTHDPGGIRTHNLSRRAAVDLRLRPRGITNVHCITSQKSADLIEIAAESWNHASFFVISQGVRINYSCS
jgi:hypothetical protein